MSVAKSEFLCAVRNSYKLGHWQHILTTAWSCSSFVSVLEGTWACLLLPFPTFWGCFSACAALHSSKGIEDVEGVYLSWRHASTLVSLPATAAFSNAQVAFPSLLEARARACLLLALTYDPRLSSGVLLLPLNNTNIAKRLALPGSSSRASTPGSVLTMDRCV